MTQRSTCITQGHRGARGDLPENTLESIRYAFETGMDRVEIDLNLTRDGALIVVHDESTHPDIVRMDGQWLEARRAWFDIDLADVEKLDVGRLRPGSIYAGRFAQQNPIDNARIPTLKQLTGLINDIRPVGRSLTIEVKCDPLAEPLPRPKVTDYAARVADAIYKLNLEQRVTVQSFNWEIVAELKTRAPDLFLGCLSSRQPDFDTIGSGSTPSPWAAGHRLVDFGFSMPKMVKAMGVAYWSSEYRDLTREDIELAGQLGLEVHCWTVNDADAIKKLLSWSVDSIISDYPALLRRMVDEYDK